MRVFDILMFGCEDIFKNSNPKTILTNNAHFECCSARMTKKNRLHTEIGTDTRALMQ